MTAGLRVIQSQIAKLPAAHFECPERPRTERLQSLCVMGVHDGGIRRRSLRHDGRFSMSLRQEKSGAPECATEIEHELVRPRLLLDEVSEGDLIWVGLDHYVVSCRVDQIVDEGVGGAAGAS
jgi:hypothetical protein